MPDGDAKSLPAVEVLVNLSLDRTFDYLIPPHLIGRIQPGMKVNVPFGKGRKPRPATVTRLSPRPDRGDLKEILEICNDVPQIPDSLSKLGAWIADYYCCTREQALRALLPSAVRSGRIKPKKIRRCYLASPEKAAAYLEKNGLRAKVRSQAIQFITLHPGAPTDTVQSVTGAKPPQLRALEKAGILNIEEVRTDRDPLRNLKIVPSVPLKLTGEQGAALDKIFSMLAPDRPSASPHVLLLHGVTCSGKTEVYLQAIARVLEQGGNAIVLVPEISLTPQTVTRFRARFGERVSVLHSGLTQGERYDEWMKVYRGEVDIAVGARSALFAPFRNLKLIIVDEEHDSSYKQSEAPRYNARDVAVVRGHMEGALVILGSATPSLESWQNAVTGKYELASMPNRWDPSIVLPAVEIVDMRLEKDDEDRIPMFSKRLIEAVRSRIQAGEQSILFLNKRGYSRQLQCACGYVPTCPDCAVAYTYHKKNASLICHFCGRIVPAITSCPVCGQADFHYVGTGTERIECLAGALFQGARIARMDSDTMTNPQKYEEVLSKFRGGDIDILIGTQMIAKGLDFPNVTLVGVLNADMGLYLPDFRALERTFQLLAQVAGRAGRGEVHGQVLIQTFSPENPAILCAAEHSCKNFFEEELPIRKELLFPPFSHLTVLHFDGEDPVLIEAKAAELVNRIAERFPAPLEISDATSAPIERIKGRYRYLSTVRTPPNAAFRAFLRAEVMNWRRTVKDVDLYVDVDALSLL